MRIVPSLNFSIIQGNSINQLADQLIDKPNFKQKLINLYGNTDDIINTLVQTHPLSVKTVEKFAKHLKGDTEKQTCENVWNFVKKNIKYVLDPSGTQKLKTASRTWYDKFGDCKSYSLLIGSLLQNLGIKAKYRLVSYSDMDIPTHVYVVTDKYVLDCCLPAFNIEKKYNFKRDIDMTKISMLSGINPKNIRKLTPEQIISRRIKIKNFAKRGQRGQTLMNKRTGKPLLLMQRHAGLMPTSNHNQSMELAMRIARDRTKIERNIVGELRGIGCRKCELFNNRIDVLNDAIAAINGNYPALEIGFIVDDMENGAYHAVSAEVASIGDIGKRKAKREEKKQERKKKREDKIKAGKKPLGKKLKAAGQKFIKAAGKVGKKILKVVTAPQRLLVKGVLEVGLPKIAPLFLYLFISDPKILAKLPAKVLRKRNKALKMRNFIVNTIGMKDAHFMGIIRNAIMKKYKMSPENLIAKSMTKKLSGIYGVGQLKYGILGIGCNCKVGATAIPVSDRWYTSQDYQVYGVGAPAADPYSAIISSALELLNKLMDVFKKKKDKDILPDKNDISDPTTDFDVEGGGSGSSEELAEEIKKQKETYGGDVVTDNSVIPEQGGGSNGGNGGGGTKEGSTQNDIDSEVEKRGMDEEGNILPDNGGKTSKGWS